MAVAALEKTAHPTWIRIALSLLDDTQVQQVVDYMVGELRVEIERDPLRNFADFGKWFTDLSSVQQEQIAAFYCTGLLNDYGLTLTWYKNQGHEGGYRFESTFTIPVASR